MSSLESGISDADSDLITTDYIDNGIAALEDFLAVKASEESLVLA